MSCKLCGREAENSGLCGYHSAARDELKKGYDRWKEAYSGMSWMQYLGKIKQLDGTGVWVKEVITLMEDGSLD